MSNTDIKNMSNAELREYYLDPSNWKGNRRLDGETYAEYKLRRAHENKASKVYHRGVVFWKSAILEPSIDLRNDFLRDIGGGYMLVLGKDGHLSKLPIPFRKVLKRGTYRKIKVTQEELDTTANKLQLKHNKDSAVSVTPEPTAAENVKVQDIAIKSTDRPKATEKTAKRARGN